MTKVLYIEAKSNAPININKQALAKLPKQLFLAYSIQYKDKAKQIKKALGNKVKGFQQVLGCTKLKTNLPILLVSDGRFHANNLAMQNSSPIYIYTDAKIEIIDKIIIQKAKAAQKAAINKFLNEKKIGILVSTKPGQDNSVLAKELKKKLEAKGKKPYIFQSNNIDLQDLENYPIKVYINTACPGLSFNNPKLVNSDDIMSFV